MRGAFWGVVCAVCVVAPAFADDTAEKCRLTQVASLPMTIKDGQLTVPITINGHERTFILDTGGYASGLSPAAIADMGLKEENVQGAIIKDVGGTRARKYVRIDSMRFGQMASQTLPLLVMDGVTTDGLLAPDLLRNFDVELDFADNKANLFHHHVCDGKAVYWASSWAVMPFDVTHDGHIRVPVTLDGEDTHAIVDTGATYSTLTLGSAEVLFGLTAKSPGMQKAGVMEGGHGGRMDSYSYPFKSLTMGGVTVNHPIVMVGDGQNALKGNQAKILLGLSILRKLHVYIAYKEEKLYFTAADAH